jgi:hypothetical protein
VAATAKRMMNREKSLLSAKGNAPGYEGGYIQSA